MRKRQRQAHAESPPLPAPAAPAQDTAAPPPTDEQPSLATVIAPPASDSHLRMITWNVMGLTGCYKDVEDIIGAHIPAVLCLTETKLVAGKDRRLTQILHDYEHVTSSVPASAVLGRHQRRLLAGSLGAWRAVRRVGHAGVMLAVHHAYSACGFLRAARVPAGLDGYAAHAIIGPGATHVTHLLGIYLPSDDTT